MFRILFILLLLLSVKMQSQDLEDIPFNLPLFIIETDGQDIPNEPKIMARLGVIDNPSGVNYTTDAFNDYEGFIGIETRGNGSIAYAKNSYGMETRDAFGENRNVSLLGLPIENDWILYASHIDKTLMRNVITFDLVRNMGRYGSRMRHIELIINGEYRGVYLLMEKIKRDKNRVDIRKAKEGRPPDSIGYIVKVDAGWNEEVGWESEILYVDESGTDYWPRYQYVYPEKDDITPEQDEFIKDFMLSVDEAMFKARYEGFDDVYQNLVDVASFIDLWIINEFTANPDGYRISTFLHYDPGSENRKLIAGPAWDYNVGYSNYFERYTFYDKWEYDNDWWPPRSSIPFWWPRMLKDDQFLNLMIKRWEELRSTLITTDLIYAKIDSVDIHLGPAIERNYEMWTDSIILEDVYWASTKTHDEDVQFFKDWIAHRIWWMDGQIQMMKSIVNEEENNGILIYPNPVRDQFNIGYYQDVEGKIDGVIIDRMGRTVQQLEIESDIGINKKNINLQTIPSGIYFIKLEIKGKHIGAQRIVVL